MFILLQQINFLLNHCINKYSFQQIFVHITTTNIHCKQDVFTKNIHLLNSLTQMGLILSYFFPFTCPPPSLYHSESYDNVEDLKVKLNLESFPEPRVTLYCRDNFPLAVKLISENVELTAIDAQNAIIWRLQRWIAEQEGKLIIISPELPNISINTLSIFVFGQHVLQLTRPNIPVTHDNMIIYNIRSVR